MYSISTSTFLLTNHLIKFDFVNFVCLASFSIHFICFLDNVIIILLFVSFIDILFFLFLLKLLHSVTLSATLLKRKSLLKENIILYNEYVYNNNMSCVNPNVFVKLGTDSTGKSILKMYPKRVDFNIRVLQEKYGGDNVLLIPCGKCVECVRSYRGQWSSRCYLESLDHEDNCFLTLTYANDNEKLNRDHLMDFIKALRNRGHVIRYFGCGEYGDKKSRPHYHLVLFGYKPADLKVFSKSKSGFYLFNSSYISNIWKKGFVTIQEFTPETASYVAGYVDKKIDKDDGFIVMSSKPGLGYNYFIRNISDIYKYGCLLIKGKTYAVPRYFDKVAERINYDLTNVKQRRLEKARTIGIAKAVTHQFENIEESIFYEGKIKERKKKKNARNL